MIGYLEHLEHDLVEAIDRSAAMPARRRSLRRPRPRPDWRALASVGFALLVLAVVLLVARPGRVLYRSGPTTPPGHRVHQKPAAISPGAPLRLVGVAARIDATTWRGAARGPGGSGTLTITGTVNFGHHACCTSPRQGGSIPQTVQIRWASRAGVVRGCVVTRTFRRPHGRFVWDGLGEVTSATGELARYRHRSLGIAGETPSASPSQARLIIEDGTRGGTPPPRHSC